MIDQAKIGKFIADKRKEKSLTQAEVAEKLGITDRAVSKWERGLCLPDSSQMIPLCTLFGITVNELLSGEEIMESKINETAEKLIVEMKRKEEETNRYLLQLEWVIGIISVASFFIIVLISAYFVSETNVPLAAILIVLSFIILLVGGYFSLNIEKTAGYYECKSCHHKYIPSLSSVMMAPHMGRTRYMKCPLCGKRTWQKKVLSK